MNHFSDFKSISGVPVRIVYSADGGPLRTVVSGRSTRPTGTFVSTKANYRALPWESKLERATMQICEVSSKVFEMLSQPHRLEMRVSGRREPMIYFPDLAVKASNSLCLDLKTARPFAHAALDSRHTHHFRRTPVTLILEIKSDNDPRVRDNDYLSKLNLARRVYKAMGMEFFIVNETRDIKGSHQKTVAEIAGRRLAMFTADDALRVTDCLRASGGTQSLSHLEDLLGSGPAARAKIYAMHIRGYVCIDILGDKGSSAPVALWD